MGIGRKIMLLACCVASLGLGRVGEQDASVSDADYFPGSLSELSRQVADVQRYQAALLKVASSPSLLRVTASQTPESSTSSNGALPDFSLPQVQTIGTAVNSQAVTADAVTPDQGPTLAGIGNLDDLAQTVVEAKSMAKGLPMALAAVVPETYLGSLGGPVEAKIKPKDLWQRNMGVVEGLQPKGETSFGSDGANQSIFQKAKVSAEDSKEFESKPVEKKETDPEKEAQAKREKFMAAIQKIGELNDETQPLGWQEYFKASDLLSDVENALEAIPKEDVDQGAVNNLLALYERFGSRDETEGSKRYERVLRHWDPDAIKFRAIAPSESVRIIGGPSHQNR